MSPKANKKQIVLEFCRTRNLQRIEMGDLRGARDEIRRHLGPGDRSSFGYIASVLRTAGYIVQYEDRYSGPVMPEPYAGRLKGILEFHDLARTEMSLQRLDEIFREYSGMGDRQGIKFVRALVKKGRLRARALATSPRVQASKRQEKQEIAYWFQVWLETPDLFADWLALRKSSDEFRKLFGVGNVAEE